MLRIDLHDVLSADAIAIEALRRIRESGAQYPWACPATSR